VGITQRMYKHATTRPLGNYFAGVVGNTQLFRCAVVSRCQHRHVTQWQLSVVDCDHTCYRTSQTDLGPLSGIFASSHKPDFRPLDRHTMAAAFSLEPGSAVLAAVSSPVCWSAAHSTRNLSRNLCFLCTTCYTAHVQERKGQAVASEDLLGSAVLPAAPPQPGTAITAAAGDSKKEKRKRDKKDKKERKEDKKVSLSSEET
jgi:hypothetical protein